MADLLVFHITKKRVKGTLYRAVGEVTKEQIKRDAEFKVHGGQIIIHVLNMDLTDGPPIKEPPTY